MGRGINATDANLTGCMVESLSFGVSGPRDIASGDFMSNINIYLQQKEKQSGKHILTRLVRWDYGVTNSEVFRDATRNVCSYGFSCTV